MNRANDIGPPARINAATSEYAGDECESVAAFRTEPASARDTTVAPAGLAVSQRYVLAIALTRVVQKRADQDVASVLFNYLYHPTGYPTDCEDGDK